VQPHWIHLEKNFDMSKRTRAPQAPKPRNWVAKLVRDPQGPYKPRAIPTKLHKQKYKHSWKNDLTDYD
jgi:hypothetical protein